MKKHELAEKISHLVVSVLDDGPVDRSRSFLPVNSKKTLIPHDLAFVTARTQVPFRGDRLAVWSGTAGNRALGAAGGDVNADAFATRLDLLPVMNQHLDEHGIVSIRVSRMTEQCVGQPLAFPLARPGTDITIVVKNVSDEPAIFVAAILGDIEYGNY